MSFLFSVSAGNVVRQCLKTYFFSPVTSIYFRTLISSKSCQITVSKSNLLHKYYLLTSHPLEWLSPQNPPEYPTLVRMRRNRNPWALLAGTRSDAAATGNGWQLCGR